MKKVNTEFYIVIRDVLVADTYNGDVPNWYFYVTTVDVTENPSYQNLGSYRRGKYRYTIVIDRELEFRPKLSERKALVQWQHDEITANQEQTRAYQSWLHRK